MAQINKPTDYFNTVLYTGNGSTQSITGVGFQPDWLWIKSRSITGNGRVHDVVRGVDKQLYTSLTNAEFTYSPNTGVTSFDSDGFSLGNDIGQNQSSVTFASWNWLADNTSGSSNTDGSITSTVSANTTSGFSIVSYTGNGTAGATVGHGLSSAPEIIFQKCRSDSLTWWHVGSTKISTGFNSYLHLNNTDAVASDSSIWNNTNPTSSVFSVGSASGTNGSSRTNIAYCFHSVKGYSKIGSYTGNGNADGTFVYTGFKPAWVMIKRTDSAQQWGIMDNKRNTFNPMNAPLFAESSQAESSSAFNNFDILSNGMKMKTGDQWTNGSGGSYIYMAFAENPLVGTNNIPAVAR